MTTIAQLDSEISELERKLQAVRTARAQLQADITAAQAMRPQGVPSNWKPHFVGTGPSLRVYAWYDPIQFGDGQGLR